jgi:hypothetical protein
MILHTDSEWRCRQYHRGDKQFQDGYEGWMPVAPVATTLRKSEVFCQKQGVFALFLIFFASRHSQKLLRKKPSAPHYLFDANLLNRFRKRSRLQY